MADEAAPGRPTATGGASLNVGCGPFRAEGWINTDLSHVPGVIEPDVIVGWDEPFPFPDGAFHRVYLGHVLEHVPWEAVPAYLDDVWRILAPGGSATVVGPDVLKILDRFTWLVNDAETRDVLFGALEDDESRQDDDAPDRPGARHAWNCHAARIIRAFDSGTATWAEIAAHPRDWFQDPGDWPLVSGSWWQCAVNARKPA